MLRLRAPLLCAFAALALAALALPLPGAAADGPTVVGPTQILFMDADSVYYLRSAQWWSDSVRHQEKLLLHGIRMQYWADHLPGDMKQVFDALSYPTGRVLLTPVGHTEEWWYYGQMDMPLRFRDGVLLNPDQFDAYLRRAESFGPRGGSLY
jgi:hypothetical protein